MRQIIEWTFTALTAFVSIYMLLIACTALSLPFGVAKHVVNPTRAVFNYEQFHDLCSVIVTRDQQYEEAKGAAEAFDKRTVGKDDPLGRNAEESNRLHQDAEGIRQARRADAQQYNADSRKWTQNIFKSKKLPYRITEETPDCEERQ
jgi:hypothetical protein